MTKNVFQLATDKGVMFVTTADPDNPNKVGGNWSGKCVARFKVTLKPGVVAKKDGLVVYTSLSKIRQNNLVNKIANKF